MLAIQLSQQEEQEFCNQMITYFRNERNENIGILQATSLLEFFVKDIGIKLYNKGIDNSKKIVSNRMNEIDFELEESKK